jgi:hypothetical protein
MNKLVLLIILSTLAPAISLACNKPVNPKSVVLFLNVNRQDQEKAALRKAACDRGDVFIDWPSSKSDKITKKSLEDFVVALEKQGRNIRTLAVSGHNGGSSIYADWETQYGGSRKIRYEDLVSVFRSRKRGITQNIEAVYLMGCYSGSHYKYSSLKEGFPNTSIISGYDSMAPLGSNPLSYNSVIKMMKAERNIQNAQTTRLLEKTLKDAATSTERYQCSAFVRDRNGVEWFFRKSPSGQPHLQSFSGDICDEVYDSKKTQLKYTFHQFLEGSIDIDSRYNTSTGQMRGVYNALRRYDGCFKRKDRMPSVETALLLNFYNNAKVNIAGAFAKKIREADDLLRSKGLGQLAGKLTVDNIKNMSRKQILDYISRLGTYANSKQHFGFWDRTKMKKYQSFLNDKFKLLDDVPAAWYDSGAYLR